MTELLLGPIVGGLSYVINESQKPSNDDSGMTANIWGRANGKGVIYVWASTKRDFSNLSEPSGVSDPLRSEDGFTGVASISGLRPNTKYYYALTFDKKFPGSNRENFYSFTTYPRHRSHDSFSFAFGSCFLPEDSEDGQIYKSIKNHDQKMDTKNPLRFLLLLGDQIYADNAKKNNLGRIASSVQNYRNVYEYNWRRETFRKLLQSLPAYMTLDDHEVDDDWYWTNNARTHASLPWWNRIPRWLKGEKPSYLSRERAINALQAYNEHQGIHRPNLNDSASQFAKPLKTRKDGKFILAEDDKGSLAYSFECGAAAFFVLDTRSHRVRPSPRHRLQGQRDSMLGEEQWQLLREWLYRIKDDYPVKFLVTSSALLSRLWIDIIYDRWGGYPAERNKLFDLIAEVDIDGLYILSGDVHAAHAVKAKIRGNSREVIPVWEFCSTPFQQKPKKISKITFYGYPFGRIRKIRREFCITEHNYGVVNVDFSKGKPIVTFEVFDEEGNEFSKDSKVIT